MRQTKTRNGGDAARADITIRRANFGIALLLQGTLYSNHKRGWRLIFRRGRRSKHTAHLIKPRLPVLQPKQPAADAPRDSFIIATVTVLVQTFPFPEGAGDMQRVIGARHKFRLIDQIEPGNRADLGEPEGGGRAAEADAGSQAGALLAAAK